MDYGDQSCMEHLRTGLPTVQISEVEGHECVTQSTDYTDAADDDDDDWLWLALLQDILTFPTYMSIPKALLNECMKLRPRCVHHFLQSMKFLDDNVQEYDESASALRLGLSRRQDTSEAKADGWETAPMKAFPVEL